MAFLAKRAPSEVVAALDLARSPPDRLEVVGQEIYVHFPTGAGRSRIGVDWFERTLGLPATMRNWNTVVNLQAMARARVAG